MNRKIWTLALALVTLFALGVLPMQAETTETTTAHFEISGPEAGSVEFEIENPEVGDVEVFWTDGGEKVVVTYDREGFLVAIAGKEIRIASQVGTLHTIPEGASGYIFQSDDEEEIVLDGSGGNAQVMIWHSDDDDDEDGEGESNQEIHIIRRQDATVEIEEDGESKVIHIPGGDDMKILRTKDGAGNVVVKVLRNGEEVDMEELAEDGTQVRVLKMEKHGGEPTLFVTAEDGDDSGMQVVRIHEIEEGGDGNHIQIQVQIRKTIEED